MKVVCVLLICLFAVCAKACVHNYECPDHESCFFGVCHRFHLPVVVKRQETQCRHDHDCPALECCSYGTCHHTHCGHPQRCHADYQCHDTHCCHNGHCVHRDLGHCHHLFPIFKSA